MDRSHFNQLARQLAGASPSRGFKQAIGGRRALLAAALATAVASLGAGTASARKKRKRNRRKKRTPRATPNAFGCLNVDDPCTSADQCCSGICEGAKGQRTCRAHDMGGCEAGPEPEGCDGTDVPCTTSSGQDGLCATTTGNAGYCLYTASCFPCRTDVDCQRANDGFYGPTAACVTCAACTDTGGLACAFAEFHPAIQGRTP